VIDLATGVVSMGLVLHRAESGIDLAPGWALDADGEPTVDPVAASSGSISPFGQHKGYALGLALEVLIASLTGAAVGTDVRGTLDAEDVCNKGDVFLCLNPATSGEAVARYLQAVRSTPPQSGFDRVLLPGEPEKAQRTARLAEGYDISTQIWDAAVDLLP
jgi:LDH2 family malate/lactate/ureidoglycolate dehydrogenase